MACVRMYRGSWVVDYRDADGKRHIEAVESRDAGNEKLGEIAKALRSKTYDPGRAKTPLQEYAVEWLQSRRAEVSRSTFTSYEYALRVHVLPTLGKYELGKLTRPVVRLFLGKLAERTKANGKPLSKDTVRIMRATLHAMLETAVEDGIVPVNVAHLKQKKNAVAQRKAKGEKQIRIRQKVFTREQLILFLRAAWEHAPRYFPLFFLMARAGLRIGEALVLKIGDIDFVERLINVERAIAKGEIGLPKHGLTRQVDMSQQLAKILGQLVLDRKEELLRMGMSVDDLPNLWLFQNEAGKPMDYSKVRKVFARLLGKAGLAQRNPHFLRHTFASLLLQQGESPVYVKEQLGHSSIDITVDTYGHLIPGGNRAAVDRLDDGNKVETFWKQENRKDLQVPEKAGATRRSRTGDLLITNQLLYRLS
jgi:integrase